MTEAQIARDAGFVEPEDLRRSISMVLHAHVERFYFMRELFFSLAESFFGLGDPRWTVRAIVLHRDGPRIWHLPGVESKRIVDIHLNSSVGQSDAEAVYELSHECLHLLAPVLGAARNLEEGVAVLFSRDCVRAFCGLYEYGAGAELLPSFRYAVQETSRLLAIDNDAIAKLRRHVPSLDDLTNQDIQQQFPEVSRGLVENLLRRFDIGASIEALRQGHQE